MKFPSVVLLSLLAQTVADTLQSSSSSDHASSSFASSPLPASTTESSLPESEIGLLSPSHISELSAHISASPTIISESSTPISESPTHDISSSASELGPLSPQILESSDHNDVSLVHESQLAASATVSSSEKCSNEGAQTCAASGQQQYLQCTNGKWAEQSCGSSTTCTQTSATKVACQKPGTESSSSSANPTPTTQIKCDTSGATMCDSTSTSGYYQCVKNIWQKMACDSGTECRISNNKVVCADPKAPVESESSSEAKVACNKNNSTMCDDSDASAFYMCTDKYWTKMQCDGDNVCLARNGKTACVDKATADAPVQPCTVANATQCASDNQKIFQICIDNYWSNSTCADNNYCLFRGDSTVCVDKATADAPVQPCTKTNATRCVDEDDTVYQFCYDGYWTNSTCDSGNVCGMKQGAALCHDPDQPIIDVPDQPCNKDKASQCVPGNETLYQVCANKLWTNLTCDGNNICRMNDDKVMCVDKDEAYLSLTQSTMYAPTPYKGLINLGVSTRDAYSWGTTMLLGTLVIAFGVAF